MAKRAGKQYRRSLKTADRKLAERSLAEFRQKVGRLIGVSLGDAGNTSDDQTTNYAYDAASGRLSSVTGNGAGQTNYAFNYTYVTNSDLLVASGANPASGFTQNYSYEPNRDWLSQATAVYGTTVQAQFDYTYTSLGQRLTATQSGAAFAAYGSNPVVYTYGYDSAGQLTTALGSISSVSMSGRQYQYAYDWAGNRASANHTTQPALAEGYTLNTLNQISTKENTTVAVQGSANATGVLVTVNGVTTTAGQAGGYWGTEAMLGNASRPASGPVDILAAQAGGGPNGTDLVTSTSVNAYVPVASETLSWNADGNLESDGTWDYTWNAENELIEMVNTPAQAAGVTVETLQFSYDYLGRRVMKEVNGVKYYYVYNGWNVMAELDSSGNVLRHFIWGLDVSGTMDRAGGIGGLLMIQDSGQTYFPGYDGNGDVATLTKAADGSLAAIYEYTPFGELLQASGSYAVSNPFRWSTKWWDAETGYAYYGARYYSPRLGRFINQDPIAEKGGLNLYGFCGNDPVDNWDWMGCSVDDTSLPKQSFGYDPDPNVVSLPIYNIDASKIGDDGSFAPFEFFTLNTNLLNTVLYHGGNMYLVIKNAGAINGKQTWYGTNLGGAVAPGKIAIKLGAISVASPPTPADMAIDTTGIIDGGLGAGATPSAATSVWGQGLYGSTAPNNQGVLGTSLTGSELAKSAFDGARNGLTLNAGGELGLGPWATGGSLSHDFSNGLLGGTAEMHNQIDWSFHADASLSASAGRTWYSNPSNPTTFQLTLGIGVGPFASIDLGFGSTGPHFWNIGFTNITTNFGVGAGREFDIQRTSTISSGSITISPKGDISTESQSPFHHP